MPNSCSNQITITSSSEAEIRNIFEELKSNFQNVTVKQDCKLGIRVDFETSWKPDFQFLESLIKKYPLCFIKNEWLSEDGLSGIWVRKDNDISSIEWMDLSLEDENFFFGN